MAGTPDLIPLEILFGNPDRVSPQLSPDGSMLSWIAPRDGVLNVWVLDLAGAADDGTVDVSAAEAVTDDTDRGIRSYTWAYDGRHLLYVQDTGGDENWHVYATDVIDGGTRDLTPFDGVQAQVVEVDEDHPDVVLLGVNADDEQLHDVYTCDLASGALTKTVENPGFIGWVADADMEVRGAAAPTPDGGMAVMVRDTVDDDWRPLFVAGQEDALTTSPISFDRSGERMLCISSVGANTGRLVWTDIASGDTTVVAEDERYDVASVSVDPHTKAPRGVAFQRDRLQWRALDDSVRADYERLDAHDAGDWSLVSRDVDDTTWLIAYSHDDGPVGYWSYERAGGAFTFLFDHQPALAPFVLAPMEPFGFDARDGLRIEGYVTWPVGRERTSVPAVLNVHGGPWARDTWGFHPEAQWLANRGYACIQVDYRGSTGYGKAHVNAGDREWGAKMHTDLLDAIDHLVADGGIDPDRVAIYGGSYGGYAALVGAAFTPDRFRCAIDIVGPSNLKTLIESVPPYWAPMIAQFHTRLGNPETDEVMLWERSPLSRVDDITIPLLIAQGANDPRVKQAESEQIVAAMVERDIPHEYLLFPDEGHGFAKPENRLHFYARAEAFLAEHC
ncbi:MAG: S9 family peptidase [Acidimicrobiales bacterium]